MKTKQDILNWYRETHRGILTSNAENALTKELSDMIDSLVNTVPVICLDGNGYDMELPAVVLWKHEVLK